MIGPVVSPCDLFLIFLVGGVLLVLCSLLGPPVSNSLAHAYYGVWPGWVVSVSMLPLTMAGGLEDPSENPTPLEMERSFLSRMGCGGTKIDGSRACVTQEARDSFW